MKSIVRRQRTGLSAGALVLAAAIAAGGSSAVTDAAARGYTNPPDAVDDALTTDEDAAGTVNVLGNDVPPPRGAPLSVSGWTDGAHGTVACNSAGDCTYIPAANYSGPDSFTYTITDGRLGDSATVQVTVGPVNDPPNAVDDVLTLSQNSVGAVDVLANDGDPEGDPLTVTGSANGAHGTVSCAAGSCSYVPAAGYSGSDTFTYTASDAGGASDAASVSVTVNATAASPPPPPPPPARPEDADVTVTITQEALPASVGARIRYLITVTNNGPGVARDVSLEQQAPAGGSFESVSTDTGTCSGSTILTCAFGSLSVGRQAHVTTIAAVAQGGTATSTANVRSSAPDPAVANNTAFASLELAATPDPVFGEAVVPVVVSGFVCVQLPTSGDCVDLRGLDQIPVGSIVDARAGRVELTVATAAGKLEKAELYEGQFHVLQSASVTEFRLAGGDFSVCTAQKAKAKAKTKTKKRKPAALTAKPRRPIRRLWGDGEGSFRTSSRYGSATVRGTVWLTEDYCNGTLIRVERGSVTVLDLLKNRTVVVTAGKSYFAEAPAAKAAKAKPKKTKKRKPASPR